MDSSELSGQAGIVGAIVVVIVAAIIGSNGNSSGPPVSVATDTPAPTDTVVPTATVDWAYSPVNRSSLGAHNGTSFALPLRGIADVPATQCSSYEGEPAAINGTLKEVLLVNATDHELNEYLSVDWFLSVRLCPTYFDIHQAPGTALDRWQAVEVNDKSYVGGVLCNAYYPCMVSVVVYADYGSGNFAQIYSGSYTAP